MVTEQGLAGKYSAEVTGRTTARNAHRDILHLYAVVNAVGLGMCVPACQHVCAPSCIFS